MNLFDASKLSPLATVPTPSASEFESDYIEARKPVILDNVGEKLEFVREWSMDYFREKLKTIRVHMPDDSGVYHFLSYRRLPFADFEDNLASTKNMYALEPLLGAGAPQGSKDDRASDFDEKALPEFIAPETLRTSNLYIGPGSNKTLLHHDEVNSLLIMVSGEKKFIVYPPEQTKNLYPYHALDIRAILQHRVLDSKVNPADLDLEAFPKIKDAVGFEGTLKAGQALFIPAGTWHYIESDDPNIAVNYFWHATPLMGWLTKPLRDFYIKRRIVVMLDYIRKVRDFCWKLIGKTA